MASGERPVSAAALDELALRIRDSTVALGAAIRLVQGQVPLRGGGANQDRRRTIAILDDAQASLTVLLRAFEASRAFSGELSGLSGRQAEVIEMIATGYTEKELARRLGMSRATAHTHVNRLFKRFNVHSRAALVALWLQPSAIKP
jgi:DNA-binding CsgD family transcriptional regulator